MKKAFLYLFVLSLLVNIFQMMYSTKKLNFETERYNHLKEKLVSVNDTVAQLRGELAEANYFSLATSENALEYLDNNGITDSNALMLKIQDEVLSYNEKEKGNSLVPYDQVNGKNFLINKIKFLNHRWIIADFSNGDLWGEVIIKYFINNDGTYNFETVESIIYPKV